MLDVQEVFRMATQKIKPDPGALERQYRDQRSHARRKKAGVFALVSALVIAGVVFGIRALPTDERGPGSQPPPTPIPTRPFAVGVLEPGTYSLAAAGVDPRPGVTITVPDGWSGGTWYVAPVGKDGMGVGVWVGGNVYADPCHWGGTLLDPPARRVDRFVAALASQPGRHTSTPTDVTIDGYAGKYIKVTAPADITDCDGGEFRTFVDNGGGWRNLTPGQRDLLWIVDAGGTTVVIDGTFPPGTTAQVQAELRQVAESVRIDPQ